jgi:hypothetical protein
MDIKYLPVRGGVCSQHDGHTAPRAEIPEQMHQLRGVLYTHIVQYLRATIKDKTMSRTQRRKSDGSLPRGRTAR